MVGTQDDPGLMVLSLHTIFDLIKKDKNSAEFEVTCSYLEVYNEVGHAIYQEIKFINSACVLFEKIVSYFISAIFRSSMICLKSHLAIWNSERTQSKE